MKYILLSILATCIAANCFAQDLYDKPEKQTFYRGTIDGLPIQLELVSEKQKISGYCIVNNLDKYQLDGSLQQKADTLELTSTLGKWLLEQKQIDIMAKNSEYSGNIVQGNNSQSVTIKPVAEFALKKVLVSDIVNAQYHYPIFLTKDSFAKEINSAISDDLKYLDEGLQNYFNYYNPAIACATCKWKLNKDYKITYYSDKLVSISVKSYEYSGGAHGNYGTNAINIASVNNRSITLKLENLFNDSAALSDFSKMVKAELEKVVVDGWIPENDDDFRNILGIFSISNEGITIYFDPYVVNCYAAGEYQITLGWNKIEKLTNKSEFTACFYQ